MLLLTVLHLTRACICEALQDMAPIDQPPLVNKFFNGIPGLRVNLIAFYSSIILTVRPLQDVVAGLIGSPSSQKHRAACVAPLPANTASPCDPSVPIHVLLAGSGK